MILLLVNPVSGKRTGRSVSEWLEQELRKKNETVEVVFSQHPGYFINFLKEKELRTYSKIGVVGGDGTFHEVVNGLMLNSSAVKPPVFLFPCGSGNALCHDLKIPTVETALEHFVKGDIIRLDILKITTKNETIYSFNILGFGLVTAINRTAEKWRWMGDSRYTLASVYHLMINKSHQAKLIVDAVFYSGKLCFVLACNTEHTGKGMRMAPGSVMNDGLIDVLIVRKVSVLQLLKLFPLIFSGKHIYSPLLQIVKAKRIEIETSKPQPINIDGEIKGSTSYQAELMVGALELIV